MMLFLENILQGNYKNVLFIIILAAISVFLLDYLMLGILLGMLLFVLLIYNDDSLLFFSILLFLVFIGEGVGPTFRLIFQITALSLILLLFFKKYGLKFKPLPKVPKQFILLILFLYGAIFISSVFSKYPGASIGLTSRLTAFLLIVYLFYSLINGYHTTKVILISLFSASAIMVVAVFYDFFVNGISLVNFISMSYRASGIISNYNATSGFFAITIPITFALLFSGIEKHKKILLVVFLFVQTFALLFTGSRSAYLAIFVAGIIILFNLNRSLLKKIALIAVITILLLYLIDPIRELLTTFLRIERGVTYRDKLWKISFNMIKENFFVGIGPGSYKYEMFNYFPIMLDSFQGKLIINLFDETSGKNVSHNFYLTLFSDLGILGFVFSVVFPLVIFSFLNKIVKHLKKIKETEYYIFIGIIATVSGMFIRGLFEGINLMSYGAIYVDLPLWLLISITLNYYSKFFIIPKSIM